MDNIDFAREFCQRMARIRAARPYSAAPGQEADNRGADNPSVTAAPCHLPLHKGGLGATAPGQEQEVGNVEAEDTAVTAAPEQDPMAEQLQMPPALMPRHMTAEQWSAMERAAARGLLPDETVTPNRRMLYFTLVGLYAAAAAGTIPVAVAKVEKRMAIEAYNRISADAELFRSTGPFYQKIEEACAAYAKRACFDNAEAMYKAVYRALPKAADRESVFGGMTGEGQGAKASGNDDAKTEANPGTAAGRGL